MRVKVSASIEGRHRVVPLVPPAVLDFDVADELHLQQASLPFPAETSPILNGLGLLDEATGHFR